MPNLIITKKCKKNKSIKLLPVSPVELVNGLRPAVFVIPCGVPSTRERHGI